MKYSKSPAQILIRWTLQKEVVKKLRVSWDPATIS